MISNPKNGWCEFNLGDFHGTPSYITNEVSELMADSNEDMDMKKTHFLHDEHGITTLIFKLCEATCFDEPVIAIIMADVNRGFPGNFMCLEPYRYQLSNHHDITF